MKLASLSDEERETVINWSDGDGGLAAIYTCQPPMIRLIEKHPRARLVEEHRSTEGEITGVEYTLPVACLAILIRPRPSAWARMLRVGPKGRKSRRRSLDSTTDPQTDLSCVVPGTARMAGR